MRDPRDIAFAHRAERALARIFDEHGIAWEYEPRTSVLERSADGSVREAFTPDFYLPELGLYVDCTVMHPSYAFRKRRKVRKLREQHGITVEVLYAHDMEALARRWSLTDLAAAATRGPNRRLKRAS